MFYNIKDSSPQQRIPWPKMSVVLRLRNCFMSVFIVLLFPDISKFFLPTVLAVLETLISHLHFRVNEAWLVS